ncbi:TPA: phosphoenolpyruvate carboxykinase (ATP), partial [Candidatus Micrarchaeota archaeon]|nr:phosphoenolpyruvate carboxykinase (ATP) [Candidatus Micrarchaeota archaeon]
FMPRVPGDYVGMFREKLERHRVPVYFVNTGWIGGPYGVGKRIDISLTRAMIRAALEGELERAGYTESPVFRLKVPRACPGVPAEVLSPERTWRKREEYYRSAEALLRELTEHFVRSFPDFRWLLDAIS